MNTKSSTNTLTEPDYDHAAIFNSLVSWIDNYRYIGRVGKGYHYNIVTKEGNSLDMVFCLAVNFIDVANTIYEDRLKYKFFWIIVEDYLEESPINWFIHSRGTTINLYLMDDNSRLHYNKIIYNLLDKLWEKSSKEIL